MAQSWLIPFWPRLEQTEAKLLDLLDLTMPEELNINSFFLADFAKASAASLPESFRQFFPLLIDTVLANPSMRDGKIILIFIYCLCITITSPCIPYKRRMKKKREQIPYNTNPLLRSGKWSVVCLKVDTWAAKMVSTAGISRHPANSWTGMSFVSLILHCLLPPNCKSF